MSDIRGIHVQVDLRRIRNNVAAIAHSSGVGVMAVVKADAYGLGAERIARAIADRVEGFCVFALEEAARANLRHTGRPTLVLGPPDSINAEDYRAHNARPAVTTEEQAQALKSASPAVCVDTGMQRFACPVEDVEPVIRAGDCREAFTHATRISQARQLSQLLGGRGLKLHAAGSSLLHEPNAVLDAVRPGIALYRDAVRITSRLIEVHDSRGPAGYSGFVAPRHGVILGGYTHGLRIGPCIINGRRTRLLEVGMQSSFVEIDARDRVGDEVVLLSDDMALIELSQSWNCSSHEALVRLTSCGQKSYVE